MLYCFQFIYIITISFLRLASKQKISLVYNLNIIFSTPFLLFNSTLYKNGAKKSKVWSIIFKGFKMFYSYCLFWEHCYCHSKLDWNVITTKRTQIVSSLVHTSQEIIIYCCKDFILFFSVIHWFNCPCWKYWYLFMPNIKVFFKGQINYCD